MKLHNRKTHMYSLCSSLNICKIKLKHNIKYMIGRKSTVL